MSVEQMSVGQMSVGEKSAHQILKLVTAWLRTYETVDVSETNGENAEVKNC